MALTVDGRLSDWGLQDRIDRGLPPGYEIHARSDGSDFVFALTSPTSIVANTTAWFNTDRNAATGHQIFGFAGGAEYNVNFAMDGTVSLFSGGAGQTLVLTGLEAAFSADRTIVEFRVPKALIGNPDAIDTLYDINDSVFLPGDYSSAPFTLFNDTGITADPAQRVAIVWSETTAKAFFSETAYSQLFMSAQAQVMQAGVPFDILTEDDLTSLATLARYDTILFPSFRNVDATKAAAIAITLEQATKQFGIGLVTAGEFMTNGADNSALPGDSYARMKLLFDATRVTGGFPADVVVKATDGGGLVLDGYANNQTIREYTGIGWNAFTSVSGNGTTIATKTIDGQTFAAVLATQTGGRNVLFSSEAVMADNNLLQKAIDYSVHGGGLSVGLQTTRNTAVVAARVDMDQSQEKFEVNPEDEGPGIYDKLIPILAEWKQSYNFVGSYYVNVGNDAINGQETDWTVSLPYYKALLDMGNELGSHSYTHPENTNLLTDAQIAFEFDQSHAVLEERLSAFLGKAVSVGGAAVPGAPEMIATSEEILKYVTYLSGGYSGVGAGYPSAFGFMTPDLAAQDKVYIAPNTAFDFTLIEFQNRTVADAEAVWAKEWAQLIANADAPVVVWPWHDYGPTAWATEGASPYTMQMFTNWIARASQAGAEFVTLADLADRTSAFAQTTITSKVVGNTITASVTAHGGIGTFALDVDGLAGGEVIKSVAGWYAYSADKVFLAQNGGNFTITVGAVADDVTRITALPMRSNLEAVSGDGRNLAFSVEGEGKVVIDLKAPGTNWTTVSGATVTSLVGEILTIDLGAIGPHDVRVTQVANVAPVIVSSGGAATAAVSVAENVTSVTTVAATDNNTAQGDAVRYSIGTTGDGALFAIDSKTGALRFVNAPDFEAPADANLDNKYVVTVLATDARGLADSQVLTVGVTNVVGINQTGNNSANTLNGSREADVLNGRGGNDLLNGLGGNDRLLGGSGNDRLLGGDGADVLIGDLGIDTMTGGAGADVFRFESTSESSPLSSARDVITDFTKGVDRIDLSAIDANTSIFSRGDQAFTFVSRPDASLGVGQIGYSYEMRDGVEYTVIEGRAGLLWDYFSVALTGRHVLSASDFFL